jgi:hypothetical protein
MLSSGSMERPTRKVLATIAMASLVSCFNNNTIGDSVNAYNINNGALAEVKTDAGVGSCEAEFTGIVVSGVGAINVTIDWGDGATTKVLNQASETNLSETHTYKPGGDYTDEFLVEICQASDPTRCKYACTGLIVKNTGCPTIEPTYVLDCTQSN